MISAIKPLIELKPVPRESKALDAIGYDLASQTLAVKFQNSAIVHHYNDVSPKKYEDMMAAESIDQFHASKIRNQHPHSIPVEDDEGAAD